MRSLAVAALFCVVAVTGCDCKPQKLKQCTPEICDDLDNDCDGEIDEDLPVLKCGVGVCAREISSCNNGVQVSCQPGDPVAEVCNGLDDDCDGDSDEGLGEPVTCGAGACARTVIACADGVGATCVPGAPGDEVCNGLDDDCDGETDETLDLPVTCGVGACLATVSACFDGAAQQCTPGAPTDEVCNGVDDNCDGATDEGLDVTLTCGTGACARTVSACSDGTPASCEPGLPGTEICNGLDDNCDGTADEALNNIVSCGLGACARYISSCSNGIPGNCVPGMPTTEICNDLDDDCDGTADEDYVCGAPTVICPPTVYATVGEPVSVTANASGVPASNMGWSISSRPAPQALPDGGTATSSATNSPTLGASTTFTPDLRGNYTLTFNAFTPASGFTTCNTLVSMDTCDTPPPPPASTACSTSWDGRPIIELASAVLPNEHYELNIAGESTLRATATPYQTYLRPASRIAAGGAIPGVDTTLELRRCVDGGARCCSSPTIIHVNVVEACSIPVSPSAANVVISEYIVAGASSPGAQEGEAIEFTNLSNCPVSLDGYHFAYRNSSASSGSYRWMNFGPQEIIPPRGVYVAIRDRAAAPSACTASLDQMTESAGLYGLKISSLAMEGPNLQSGWFNNTGGGQSNLQIAPGTVVDAASLGFANPITEVAPYTGYAVCHGAGYNAVNSCGDITSASRVDLSPNQLGRLWHPCDNLTSPVPACVRD